MRQQFSSLCYEREESFVVKQYLKESSENLCFTITYLGIISGTVVVVFLCFGTFFFFDIEFKGKKHSVKAISKSFI